MRKNLPHRTKVAVIGLGKLGLPMAVAMAERGIQVFGTDRDSKRMELIRRGRSPIEEPGVQSRLGKLIRQKRLILCDCQRAVTESQASFVAVNTPERSKGEMDTRDLEAAAAEIGGALRESSRFHLVSINSTVLPETTDRRLRPILEKTSGKSVGKEIGLAANPVFIALTTVIRDFLNPPVVVAGASDERSSRWLERFYGRICENHPPVLKTTPLMAEIIKLAHNAYCTTKMAFINEVADLCSRVSGGDKKKLEEFFVLGGERSGKFLKTGLGFGGPCFPRDLRFFLAFLEGKGLRPPLLTSVISSNHRHAEELIRQIEKKAGFLKGKRISVLGLSYKPGVRNFEESFPLRLVKGLSRAGARLFLYDPLLKKGLPRDGFLFQGVDSTKVKFEKTLRSALRKSEVCILAHPLKEFFGCRKDFLTRPSSPLIFDPWGVLSS